MKYIIIGYTSDIDIKSNTVKIKYFVLAFSNGFAPVPYWTDNIDEVIYFSSRIEAQHVIDICGFDNCIVYGIGDNHNE